VTPRSLQHMKRNWLILLVVAVCLGLTWVFPLFHIVPLEQVAQARSAAQFDAPTFASEFWREQLIPTFEQATDATELIAEIKRDPDAARTSFGKSVGIGRVYLYFLRGEGTIIALDKAGVAVSCVAPNDEADLVFKTGLLFGNTIRDATGQLKAGDFANSQDFNAISKELNRIVENDVQPALKEQSQVGKKIRFVGCAEVRVSSKKLLPLAVIPMLVEFPE
jgi:predicted lipoprotein